MNTSLLHTNFLTACILLSLPLALVAQGPGSRPGSRGGMGDFQDDAA